MITNIKIKKIYPHPHNPRKNLGDLTELAESIKTSGILQNLTVVPQEAGYCSSCSLYIPGAAKCTEDHDKNERPPCSKWQSNDTYTAVIGHRRLAAAKLAGLTEVPCVIADMDYKTQIATMLLENMQRSDLTIYEQAQGFQMMMNLGETLDGISKATGFSETTVRRRMKLLDLDQDKFKESQSRGATLMDYAELDKIENSELRNTVLESIGTPNFQYGLKKAIDKEKRDKWAAVIVAELEKFANHVENTSGMQYAKAYYPGGGAEVTVPKDAKETEYFFIVRSYGIELYKKSEQQAIPDGENEERERKQREQSERKAKLDEIAERAFGLRKDFIKGYHGHKDDMVNILEFMLMNCLNREYLDFESDYMLELLDLELPEEDNDNFDEDAFICEKVMGAFHKSPVRVSLMAVYCQTGDFKNQSYYDWQGKYMKNRRLDTIYDCLVKFGYEISDEEQALRNGTHEMFGEV